MMQVADMETLYEGLVLQVLWAKGWSCELFNLIVRMRCGPGRWPRGCMFPGVSEPLRSTSMVQMCAASCF